MEGIYKQSMFQLLSIEFGRRMKEIREGKGLKQKHISIITGISESYLSRIEQGKVNIKLETMARIISYLECSPTLFFTTTDFDKNIS